MAAAATSSKPETSRLLDLLPNQLPADFLKEITDGFSTEREVGRGASGTVYRGILNDGTQIAVKRIYSSQVMPDKRFQNEEFCTRVNGMEKESECLSDQPNKVNGVDKQPQCCIFGLLSGIWHKNQQHGERITLYKDEPQKIPYKLLADITQGFSEKAKIGSGAFGEVYKGVLRDGTEIAVKKLRFMQGGFDNKQFENELSHLKGLKHENIVRIVGFCDETEHEVMLYQGKCVLVDIIHRILCLEFVPNGSLGKILSEKFSGHNWNVRFKIIKGICVGLKYLHDSGIMHFDLKPDNILLDEKMVPKIADFGISRLAAGEADTIKTISNLGTVGFMPPEFINKQIISKHFDIFSLGVIIKRIVVSGLDDYMSIGDMEDQAFIEHVHDSWKKKLQETLSYASLEVDSEQVRTCIEIAVFCMEADRYKRPKMEDIVCKLKKVETTEFGDSRSQIEEGLLKDGSSVISSVPPEKQFQNEVEILMMIRHENIVRLFGYCHESQKKVIEHNGRYILVDVVVNCLCYEYFSNGSLNRYISGESRIDWATCFKIIKGICLGLYFLHYQLGRPIVHGNLMPDNIFLDENMVPKIADFGLSRLFGEEQSRIFTINVAGAIGYMAPEYIYRGEFSKDSDIYSLGLLIIEITTGERNQRSKDNMCGRNFIDYAHKNWASDEHIVSKYLSLDANSLHQVKKCITVGLRCVEVDRRKRPTIVEILDVLDGKLH